MVCPDAYRVSHDEFSSQIHTDNWVTDFVKKNQDKWKRHFAGQQQAAAREQSDASKLRSMQEELEKLRAEIRSQRLRQEAEKKTIEWAFSQINYINPSIRKCQERIRILEKNVGSTQAPSGSSTNLQDRLQTVEDRVAKLTQQAVEEAEDVVLRSLETSPDNLPRWHKVWDPEQKEFYYYKRGPAGEPGEGTWEKPEGVDMTDIVQDAPQVSDEDEEYAAQRPEKGEPMGLPGPRGADQDEIYSSGQQEG